MDSVIHHLNNWTLVANFQSKQTAERGLKCEQFYEHGSSELTLK